MTQSEIELIDGSNYGVVRKDRISSNQIKTRPASFSAFLKVWNNYRLKCYNEKLNSQKESVLTQNSNNVPTNVFEQEKTKSLVLSRLEEKIKILSKQTVPTNYVDNRAIKLRSKMMNNMVGNCYSAYSNGNENIDNVIKNENKSNDDLNAIVGNVSNESVNSVVVENTVEDASINNIVENDVVTNAEPVVFDNSKENVVAETPVESELVTTVEPVVVDNPTETVFAETPVESELVTSVEPVVVDNPTENVVAETPVESELVTTVEPVVVDNPTETVFAETPVESELVTSVEPVVVDNPTETVFAETPVESEPVNSFDTKVSFDEPVISSVNNIIDENESNSAIGISSDDVKDAINAVLSRDDALDNTIQSKNNDDLMFDNDGPALFEIINPVDSDEKGTVNVQNNYSNNDGDIKSVVSKNGSSKAKIDRYNSDGDIKVSSVSPFKVITFKDIFRPSVKSFNDSVIENVSEVSENNNYDRYVPIVVPEREISIKKEAVVNNTNDNELDVSNVQDMKNQYLKLQQLLRSKTARLNSVKAQRDAIKSEVESSSRSKEDATASLNEKYQLMAKYIDDLQRQCAIVDDETASNEDDINNSRHIIEENRQAVNSTQRAIEELDDILRDSSTYYETENYNHSRRVA